MTLSGLVIPSRGLVPCMGSNPCIMNRISRMRMLRGVVRWVGNAYVVVMNET